MTDEKIARPKKPELKSGKSNFVIAMTDAEGGYIEYAGSTKLNIVSEVLKMIKQEEIKQTKLKGRSYCAKAAKRSYLDLNKLCKKHIDLNKGK